MNPYTAERLADDCLLVPDSGLDFGLVDELASRAVALGENEGAVAYFQACKALSEYRQKRFDEAVAWAEKSLESTETLARARSCAVLAMAQWRLGKKDAARAALAEGNELAPILAGRGGTADVGDPWVAWLFARIALDEAAALVQTPAAASPNSNVR